MRVCGPGWKRDLFRFDSELELSTFQADYERRLVNSGYTFEAFRHDRRGESTQPPQFSGPERRLQQASEGT